MLTSFLEILIFGSLILLGIILIANPLNVNKKANVWFGTFLLICATFWLRVIVSFVSPHNMELNSVLFLNFIQFLSPVTFYLSIRYFTNPEYKIRRHILLYLAIPAIYLTLLILDSLLVKSFNFVLLVLTLIHAIAYTILPLFQIRKHKKHILHFSANIEEIDLAWLESIVWAALFLVLGISIFHLVFFKSPLNLFMNSFIYLIVIFAAYHSLKQKEIFPANEDRSEALLLVSESGTNSVQSKIMSDDRLVEVKSRLHELLTREELYLDTELSLAKLAKMINLSSHQLSYVINHGFNQNFYGIINKFRVEKAKMLLADRELNKYSIIGIAYESGFNSKTSFNTIFKKMTGQTPSEFKKTCSDL